METIYSTQNINSEYYLEMGIDDNMPVLYVFKDGDIFNAHITMGTFEQEMKNTIDCYITVHDSDPSIKDISIWRQWYRQLKELDYIK